MTTTLVTRNAMDVLCLSPVIHFDQDPLRYISESLCIFTHIQKSSTEILAVEPPHTQKSQLTFCVKRRTLVKFISFRSALHDNLFDLQHQLKDTEYLLLACKDLSDNWQLQGTLHFTSIERVRTWTMSRVYPATFSRTIKRSKCQNKSVCVFHVDPLRLFKVKICFTVVCWG